MRSSCKPNDGRSITSIGMCLLVYISLKACPICLIAGEPAAIDWPIYHGDSGLRGVSPVPLPDTLVVKWRYRVGSPVSISPVVAGDRIIVVAGNGVLFAIDRQGKKVWSASLAKPAHPDVEAQETFSTPPLCVAGTVLVGSDRGFLHAFAADTGEARWKQKIGDDLLGSPNWVPAEAGGEPRVLVMSRNDGVLKFLEIASGKCLWAADPVSRCDTPPAVGAGVAVFGACDSALHILSLTNGKPVGEIKLDERGPMAAGAAVDGRQSFVGMRDGSVVCVDIPGARVTWISRCASNEVFTTPAVTSNRVIVGSSDGRVYCLDRESGKTLWAATTDGSPSSPSVAGDKVVVAAEGTLLMFNLQSGKRVWTDKPGDTLTSPAIIGDKVIVGTDDGFLILYGPASKPQEKP